jgi:hypothetical protein
MSYFPRISIACPAQIVANWESTPIGNLFDIDGNINLRIQPQTYTRIEEGEKCRFNDFFSGVNYQLSPQRIGFTVKVEDKRDELLIALSEVSRLSIGSGYRFFVPINILDYCRLDSFTDYAQGFTNRQGQIWVEDRTGAVKRGKIVCNESAIGDPVITEFPTGGGYNNGFTLKFLSLKKELIG